LVQDEQYNDDVVEVDMLVEVNVCEDAQEFEAVNDDVQEDVPAALDELHEVHRQVMEALDCGNALHREAATDD